MREASLTDLSRDRVLAALRTRALGRSLEVRDETASTNDDARAAAAAGAPRGHVIVADSQTRGRGARGRTWSSPRGVDLYLSIVERVALEPARVAPLTLAVGLGVADAACALVPGIEPRVKWPNDVWVEGRKTAGILVEASSTGGRVESLVIGIGLGVNRVELEPELAGSATSLRLEARRRDAAAGALDRSIALAMLLDHVERWVDRFVAEGAPPIVRAVEERLALRGERVRVDDLDGVLVGLAPSGAVRLRTASGEREAIAGTLRPVR